MPFLGERNVILSSEATERTPQGAWDSADETKSRVRRRVVIVGIPGVGKSTVVNSVIEQMGSNGVRVNVVNYGSVMMEEASRLFGVKSRDDMRKLSIEKQRELQIHAASKISRLEDDYVIVDTHLFISTKEGLWPGMPLNVLQALNPTNLVLVTASVEEIKKRRETDSSRTRDNSTIESLRMETEAARTFLYSSGLILGCPALLVYNSDGLVDETAKKIVDSVFIS